MTTLSGLRVRKLPRCVHRNFQESSSVRRLYFFFSLWACLSSVPGPAEALKVSMPARKTAILGTNVTLQCQISDYPPPELDIKKTIFIWYLETSEGNKVEKLYSVVAGEHSSNRNGSRLDTIQLKNGNAALFLPQIQLNEEGKYICLVILTSNKVEGATILNLVVEPTVQLSPKELEIENGNVKTLTCTVNKFYPDAIVILWQEHSKQMLDKGVLAEDICTGTSVRNSDGTYNTTSKLRLQPSSQDQGNVYSCIVQHESFARYPVYSVTLTVTDPNSTTRLIIWLVLGFLIFFLLVGLLLYFVFLKKHPPSVEMVGSEELKHLEETQLQCLISHFRPKPLQVDLFLVIEVQNTKQKIASWHTTSVEEPMEDDENFPLLGNLKDMFKFYPDLKSKPKTHYDFQWKICINPDIQKLKKFELLLEVKHKGFQHGSFSKRKSFKVIALPMLHEVHCSTNVPRSNEPLTLSCKIHSYFPETLEVCWNNDDGILDSSFSTPPTKGADGLYFCISEIQYNPQVEDSGKRFVCRAKLEGSQAYKESEWQMDIVVLAPKVCKIECKPSVPECGKCITLSCLLTEYHPPECDIYWRKGFEELMDATVKTEEPQLDRMSKLYSRTSEITFIPSAEDHEVEFFVEINHCKKIVRKGYTVMLKDFPKLSNIVIEPSDADYGESVNLTCDVTDFNPKKIGTQWFLGDNSVMNGVVTEDLDMACNGCYKLTSVFELRATASVCDKAICFRVSHARLRKPITREVYLKLPVKRPVLSEIKVTPDHQNILLEIFISQFAPHDIQVRWYHGWRQISETINPKNIEIGKDHLCYLVSKIHLDPKALDFGKTIRCEVKHPTSTEEKSLTLNTIDFSDLLEETQYHHHES
ncbi:natural cytotoxicity triggering receptor 3 ligand 1 [Pantherophis guttatus]|uniref:Natural cytotoxicity triggering receptor 3 ligand 1 n=1 Tax=Pantherophis guttatus TaxID=94885 RepID=A0A6P9BSE0_PANGU|nr:natural cytotoxicity triggering receptor 3 ligand 1 [Pantherophis guttatus]